MKNYLAIILIIGLIFIFVSFRSSKKPNKSLKNFIIRIKSKSTKEKYDQVILDKLTFDPELNIVFNAWDLEAELKEKADIHRARLKKYGKSKLNGEMLYIGPKGGIFKLSLRGNKKYI
tara:strand:- start:1722 stop:2075 length:354 start_codon:yes stop_codon:yes gene_type:complete